MLYCGLEKRISFNRGDQSRQIVFTNITSLYANLTLSIGSVIRRFIFAKEIIQMVGKNNPKEIDQAL
jgi:hypothetical protein